MNIMTLFWFFLESLVNFFVFPSNSRLFKLLCIMLFFPFSIYLIEVFFVFFCFSVRFFLSFFRIWDYLNCYIWRRIKWVPPFTPTATGIILCIIICTFICLLLFIGIKHWAFIYYFFFIVNINLIIWCLWKYLL
jgi:hypothetical protein